MENNYPKFGSAWQHRSDRVYTILGIANTENLNPKYPITVIFVGELGIFGQNL